MARARRGCWEEVRGSISGCDRLVERRRAARGAPEESGPARRAGHRTWLRQAPTPPTQPVYKLPEQLARRPGAGRRERRPIRARDTAGRPRQPIARLEVMSVLFIARRYMYAC